jgi:hypothetical protein
MAHPLGRGDRPMPAWAVKWMMAFFPPLWVNGVWPQHISPDYRQARITLRLGFLNRNLQGTVWGGAYLSAVDPWYGILLWLALKKEGMHTYVFTQSMTAEFKKQGRGTLTIDFTLTQEILDQALETLRTVGKWIHPFEVLVHDAKGDVCFRSVVTMNLRRPDYVSVRPIDPPPQGLPL